MSDAGVWDFGVPMITPGWRAACSPPTSPCRPTRRRRGLFGDIAKSVGGGIKDVASGFGDVAKAALPFASLGATGWASPRPFKPEIKRRNKTRSWAGQRNFKSRRRPSGWRGGAVDAVGGRCPGQSPTRRKSPLPCKP